MPFVKTTKSNSYFKRFQTKFRRRRESKTDYYARKRMVTQDLNKYGTPKFRLVARITNSKVIAQVVYSMQKGDFCITQAHSQELAKWGLSTGYTSYSAAYATGLLVSRRLLTKLRLADMFKGTIEADGKDYDVACDVEAVKASKRPFKAILDIGNVKATTGNRVFGVLKGACDGGLHVPHSVRKYPGYFKEEGQRKGEYNADTHRARIMGEHINNYIDELEKNEVIFVPAWPQNIFSMEFDRFITVKPGYQFELYLISFLPKKIGGNPWS
jgi:large subunit ribosomal protein L5e